MSPLFVLVLVGGLLACIGYLSLQLYISRRIVDAFQRAAVVVPAAPAPPSSLRSGLTVLGLVLLASFVAMVLAR